MPKLGMGEIRRRQLIDATQVVLHREGMDDLTLKKIADEAGVVTSQITHYFGTKEALLNATMADLVVGVLREVHTRRTSAASVVDELAAIVHGNLAASQTSDAAVSVWLYFWSRVPFDAEFKRLQNICDYQLRKYVFGSLQGVVPRSVAAGTAGVIIALAYGMWLRHAYAGQEYDVGELHAVMLGIVRSQVEIARRDGRLKRMPDLDRLVATREPKPSNASATRRR